MVATSAHHIVRVTVRIDAVSLHRDVDLTLPTSSTFAEVLPEIARFVDLPRVHRPWQATTAGGALLDLHTPLYQLKLRDGSIVVLRPHEPVDPPVVRDAAESLASTAGEETFVPGLGTAASAVGCVAAGFALFPLLGPPAAMAAAGALMLLLSLVSRSRALFHLGTLTAAAACGAWVAGPPSAWIDARDPALGALAAAGTLAVGTLAGCVLSLAYDSLAAASFTVSLGLLLAAATRAGGFLPSSSSPAAVAVLTGLIVVAAAPGIATRAAGLRVPRIPTAGEELSTTDGYLADAETRSRRARVLLTGINFGAAAIMIPALLSLARSGNAWAIVLSLCVAGALVLHGARHHDTGPRLALTAIALTGVLSCGVVAAVSSSTAALVVALIVCAVTATTVLWASRIPELEPTTVVWLERLETVAIIASLPVVVHVAGGFALIRGM
ncbi:hypothetical protein CAPI_01570 [Corynebacterium capitovis DSM 44611]|uniref:type VII secretion integral membrane protein EccD n=1 Tax=Corynebacterium capitovis TaxID=131081 RepID=UPI00037B0E5F|nr:type VII secretion integral membrane protein EccD [Corynebacterium capitovis]WKD56888.1 hypothetical protein CAPI_01570 [Corynebacterium capitovis DSM 44611]